MASRAHGSSARLHRRGHSASSMTSQQLSPLADQASILEGLPLSDSRPHRPMPSASHHHNKIKPYLRKLSSKDDNALDLSQPAAENERLAGLGISDYGSAASVKDVNFAPVNGRNRHARSISNTSQFSTSSSLQRPAAPYLPPIRQSYTPPIARSTPASILGSETEADDIMANEEYLRQQAFDPARRSGSISSFTPGGPPTLRIHTTGSSTRLAGSYSQSSTSLTSPMAQTHNRTRGDTLRSLESTTSPSSRTSFDKAFGFVRGGRDSPIDPVERAANIRAAREAFAAKEEAKAERDLRKQHKKSEQPKPDTHAHKRDRSISDSNEKTPRPSIRGRQYSDHREAHTRTLPNYTAPRSAEKPSRAFPRATKHREAKGSWAKFVAWLRTRMLRIKRTLRISH
ncbi:hypothetical protein CC80DRAFT_417223 [Byssothecium circinans]|uniref:Pal1-domain-containing protein n=1 Tax=Byssothecium circinans TaxID=147558 RepID=A0A6A5TQG7_9PLEO|nr:hypothetical protein CC80DRAFT_417223 [Byssothecium circinans]